MFSKICLWVLLAVGIVVSVLFYVGGSQGSLEVAGDFLSIPKFTDLMLYWNYTLVGLVCLATFGFVCYDFVKTWDDTIANTNCLIINDEIGMNYIKDKNKDWYDSLVNNDIKSLVIFSHVFLGLNQLSSITKNK